MRRHVPYRFIFLFIFFIHLCSAVTAQTEPTVGQPKPGEPTDPKAVKTFASAREWEKNRSYDIAINEYRKANKQDGGNCSECLQRAYNLANKLGAFKNGIDIAREWLLAAQTDQQKAMAHYRLALSLQALGIQSKKQPPLAESVNEFKDAIDLDRRLVTAHYHLGVSLARLMQDDAARAEFNTFLADDRKNPSLHPRAERFMDRIELARATMAPPFSATTLDGQRISMDSLAGKVVLIDFWATWCGPCREALPRIQKIARKFDGQPFTVLSISLDSDEAAWKQFVDKNQMTWLQVRDGGFNGRVAQLFNVNAIPATFTIDADGVLEDQHVGDAEIEGKLKKLIARAVEVANHPPAPAATEKPGETVEQAPPL